jgi:RHS repeat-associated protein
MARIPARRYRAEVLEGRATVPSGTTPDDRHTAVAGDTISSTSWVLTTNGVARSRTHDRQNKLTGVGSKTLSYDANVNLTIDEAGRAFTYDAWDRLVAVEHAGSNPLAGYAYDGLGRRITADDGAAREFCYSDAWQVLEERVSGGVVAENVWGLAYVDALVLRDCDADGLGGTPEERLYAHQDASWNVTVLSPASGSRGSSSNEWLHLHQGGRYDGASGLYHFRNRGSSPALGRWLSQEPIGFAAGDSNLYRYVKNNPIVLSDPSGLAAKEPKFITDIRIFLSESKDVQDLLDECNKRKDVAPGPKGGRYNPSEPHEEGGWIYYNSETNTFEVAIAGTDRILGNYAMNLNDPPKPAPGFDLVGDFHIHPHPGGRGPSPADMDGAARLEYPRFLITPKYCSSKYDIVRGDIERIPARPIRRSGASIGRQN